ncbi:MAG: cupin domain-containing protein [Rubripirellula sp.]|nr:cupin domain-containing protein [Rubripirellula sp.]
MSHVIDPRKVAANLSDFWSPRIVAEMDDSFVKVAKIKGEFPWHTHEHEDEVFMVLDGEMSIELQDRTVKLKCGELFVVPKGTRHHPVAEEVCLIMLFEPKSTEHMGGVVNDNTRTIAEQRGPQ